MTIGRDEMAEHVRAGRAQRWAYELGRDRLVLTAASLDGTWYVVMDGEENYEQAPAPLAALLTVLESCLHVESAYLRVRYPLVALQMAQVPAEAASCR
jgi:hypothetical protein